MLDNPFQPELPPGPFHRRATLAIARPLLSSLLGLHQMAELYREVAGEPEGPFEERALRRLDVTIDADPGDLAHIPQAGGLIVAANHPHGALDGLVLATLLRRVRGDVRIVANRLLERIPEMRPACFFVDPFEGPEAAARSLAGLRAAHLWLKGGGAIVMFPSGEVAHGRPADGMSGDSAWRDTAGRLASATRAAVVPAYIEGTASRLFHAAGFVHPRLRTALLARELLRKRGSRIAVRFGPPLDSRTFSPSSATATMRSASERLAVRPGRVLTHGHASGIAREIDGLPQSHCLVQGGSQRVFCASADQIPATLEEIGRLRAIAYRQVGEGTGTDLDLDRFDRHYLHLFSWDTAERQVVGAYRLGRTDDIVRTHGLDGLYTRTLFRYDRSLVDRLSPALELGRSFVQPAYQRHHTALQLLWKGIGAFVTRHPEYRHLFGPVSVSARYSGASHALLMAFLEQHHLDASLAELVEALTPARRTRRDEPVPPATFEEVNRAVAAFEPDGKEVPVLLRQYLKLNARLIGFNVDTSFGDALDALMTVDLAHVSPAILTRYLGRDGAARFLAQHRQDTPRAA